MYRSEERRVGKECRSQLAPEQQKKKTAVRLRRLRGHMAGLGLPVRPGSEVWDSTPPASSPSGSSRFLCFFFSSRRRHTRSVSAFLLNRSSDLADIAFDANQTGKKFRVGIKSNISTNRNNLISGVDRC